MSEGSRDDTGAEVETASQASKVKYVPETISAEDEEKALRAWQELMAELDLEKSLAVAASESDSYTTILKEDKKECSIYGVGFEEEANVLRDLEVNNFNHRKGDKLCEIGSPHIENMDCLHALSFMRYESDSKVSPSTLRILLKKLQDLTSVKRENRVLLGQNSGCEIILAVVQDYARGEINLDGNEILEGGCMVIANLSYDTRNKTKFGELGACNVITDVLRMHVSKAGIVKRACWAIINLAVSHPPNVQKFLTCGALEPLTIMLSKHADDAGIAQWGCLAIAYLVAAPQNAAMAHKYSTCKVLVQILCRHRNNAGVIEEALRAIGALAYENNDNREEVGRMEDSEGGSMVDIIESIRRFRDNTEIAYWGCMCLSNLSRENENNRIVLFSLEIFPCILDVISQHFENFAVVDQCLWSLLMFVKYSEYAGILGSLASEPVVKVLIQYVDNAGIVERSSKILTYLTSVTTDNFLDNINVVVNADSCLETVVTALQNHQRNTEHTAALYWIVVLMNNLCNDKPRVIYLLKPI